MGKNAVGNTGEILLHIQKENLFSSMLAQAGLCFYPGYEFCFTTTSN